MCPQCFLLAVLTLRETDYKCQINTWRGHLIQKADPHKTWAIRIHTNIKYLFYVHYQKVGNDPLPSKKLQVSKLLLDCCSPLIQCQILHWHTKTRKHNICSKDFIFIVSIVMKWKINLSTLWLCKLHIKHKTTPQWLAKPSGKNKLQTSVVAQDNFMKHLAALNCYWRK